MKSIFVALLLGVSVVTTFCLTYARTQVIGQAPIAQAPTSDNSGSYRYYYPVQELPITNLPPVHNYGNQVSYRLPSDCAKALNVSQTRGGYILVGYLTAEGELKAIQYGPGDDTYSFTFTK